MFLEVPGFQGVLHNDPAGFPEGSLYIAYSISTMTVSVS